MSPETLAEIALEAAEAASAVHARALGLVHVKDAQEKGVSDFVSEVDVEAEAEALRVIRRHAPSHGILAEESGFGGMEVDAIAPRIAPLWIVDPLDGTTNFLHGYPQFCASVGVVVDGIPVAGAVVSHPLQLRYVGWHGGGAWRNGERIYVSETSTLRHALIGTGFPFKRPDEISGYLEQLGRVLRATSGVRRGGSAALDLCALASGQLDAFWEGWLAPWDVAGGLAILSAAGGVWGHLDGAPLDVTQGGPVLAANGGALREALAKEIRGAR